MCSKPFLSPPRAVEWKSRAVQRAYGKCFGKSLAAKQTDSEKRSQNLGKTLTRPWATAPLWPECFGSAA